jgi:hypothetical protein
VKYADEVGSSAMIYMPNFIKIGLGFQKLICGDTHAGAHTRQQGDLISLLLFFSKLGKNGKKDKMFMCLIN